MLTYYIDDQCTKYVLASNGTHVVYFNLVLIALNDSIIIFSNCIRNIFKLYHIMLTLNTHFCAWEGPYWVLRHSRVKVEATNRRFMAYSIVCTSPWSINSNFMLSDIKVVFNTTIPRKKWLHVYVHTNWKNANPEWVGFKGFKVSHILILKLQMKIRYINTP